MYRYAFFIIFLLVPVAYAQKADNSASAKIRALEDRRVEAMLKKDTKTLEELFADDATYTHGNGAIENKKQFIDNLRPTGSRTYNALTFNKDIVIRFYKNAAILTGRANLNAQLTGLPPNISEISFISVWIKQKGKWKFAAWQSTRVQ